MEGRVGRMEVGDGLGDGGTDFPVGEENRIVSGRSLNWFIRLKNDSLCDGIAVNDLCGLGGHFYVGRHFCKMR